MSVNAFFSTNAGFRGVSKFYKELSQFTNIDKVSYGSIRQWILRIGLGLLQSPIGQHDDWIYIMDFSIQLGRERCLLILGVRHESIYNNGYDLQHKDVRVLDIFVQHNFTSEKVTERINNTAKRTGVPCQIISDKGSDISGGIENYCRQNKKEVIHSNDISHMIGLVLKHHIPKDKRWIDLQADLYSLTQQTKQTELSFLRPMSLCTKARWMNLNKEVEYLKNIFKYASKKDFSLISEEIKIKNHSEIFDKLKTYPKTKREQNKLKKLLKSSFSDKESANVLLKKNGLGDTTLLEFEDYGKIRFEEKFSILNKHQKYIEELYELNNIAEKIKTIIRYKGLSQNSLGEINSLYDHINYQSVKQAFNKINNNLVLEHSKCGINKRPLLLCSDIIESIFGKFKSKSNQTVGGIYQTVLSIVLICYEVTPEIIQDTLMNVKISDVKNWFDSMTGTSNLNKRRIAFAN